MSYVLMCNIPWDKENEYRHDIKLSIPIDKIRGIHTIWVPFTQGKYIRMTVARRLMLYDNGKVVEL